MKSAIGSVRFSGREQVEVLDKAESKQSVVEQLHQSHEQTRKQDKTSQKEQKMEL